MKKTSIISSILALMTLLGFALVAPSAASAAPAPAAPVQVSTVSAAAYAMVPILQNTPGTTSGSGCLTAADGTRTCSFTVKGNWSYTCLTCQQPVVQLRSGVTDNFTGRCIELYANRLYNLSNGLYTNKGNGGMQLQATAPLNSRVTADANVGMQSTQKLVQSWKACTRDGLSGSASALSGNGLP